jgi:hypothetical protein
MSVSILVASGHVYVSRSGVCVCRVRVHAWCAPLIAHTNALSLAARLQFEDIAGWISMLDNAQRFSIAIFSFDANTIRDTLINKLHASISKRPTIKTAIRRTFYRVRLKIRDEGHL